MDLRSLEEGLFNDPTLSRLAGLAKRKRVPIFLVGGYLRDLYLGRGSKDYDFTLPQEDFPFLAAIEETFQFRFHRIGKDPDRFTFRIVTDDFSMDITFFQGSTIGDDLVKRDFTLNTVAFSLEEGTWHFVKGALEDLQNKTIRPVSSGSLTDDPLRMLRAVRYVCLLEGFSLDESLTREMVRKKALISNVSGERVKVELDQILLSPRVSIGMKILHQTGLLLTLFPEFKGLEDLRQGDYHHLAVLPHTLLAIEKIAWAEDRLREKGWTLTPSEEDRLALFYAVFFHDIGKKSTLSTDTKGTLHFYRHETASRQESERIMDRLKFPNRMREKVVRLIQNHMKILNLSHETKEPSLRRLVHRIGEHVPLLVLHSMADKKASRGVLSLENDELVERHCFRLLKLFNDPDLVHPLSLITGEDVLSLGYSAGPEVGRILGFIRRMQVEGRIRTRQEALWILRKRYGLDSDAPQG